MSRSPGGLSCVDVLTRLSAALDGDLEPTERAAVEAHVRECTDCARFGASFAVVVRGLQASAGAGSLDGGVLARLQRALRAEP